MFLLTIILLKLFEFCFCIYAIYRMPHYDEFFEKDYKLFMIMGTLDAIFETYKHTTIPNKSLISDSCEAIK